MPILLLEHMLTDLTDVGRCIVANLVTARGAELAKPDSEEEEGHSSRHASHSTDSCAEVDRVLFTTAGAAAAADIAARPEYALNCSWPEAVEKC